MSGEILQQTTLAGRPVGDGVLRGIRTSALSACLRTVAAWIVRSGERRALHELAEDRRLLSDVGLTREQALHEAHKAFWRR